MADVNIGQEERINRICYVEPNDVFDSIDGIPVTPPYEDFSIAFDLIVKVASRFRSNEVRGNGGEVDSDGNYQWVISWTSAPKQDSPSWVTFMSGHDVGKGTNSLTTSYTDISFDQYFEGEEIEGLGVEQVNVTFESWYTPTVTIKFVDTRGSAFFGREEAIHYNDKLTADNVFGCFATVPYPEFKLQIKGFLGKPVTYQLACSNFKAELNSQTGNFEFTVSFIGYSYALLTDIPLDYLIAAPLNPYVGVEYWNKHKTDAAWQMLGEDGKPEKEPVTLFEFLRDIKNAQATYNEKQSAISDGTNGDLSAIQQEKTLLNNVLNNFNTFYQSLIKDVNNFYTDVTNEDDKKRQIVLFSDKENIRLTNASGTYKTFVEAVKTYNDAFSTTMIGKEKMPNGWELNCPLDIKGIDTFTISKGIITFSGLNGREASINNIKSLKFNDNRTLTESTIREILNHIQNGKNDAILHRYCYVIDCGTLITDISTNVENLEASKTRMEAEISKAIDEDVTSILPFKPYIGNVFKLLFCHLETFCHIMYEASKDIQSEAVNGLRNPSTLGINNLQSQTDLFVNNGDHKDVTVPAWIGIVNSKATTTDGENVTIEDDAETFGWPGDLKGNFVEEKVVYGFEMAIQSLEETEEAQKDESTELNSFPITTCDFNNRGNVFKDISNTSLSELSGYLSIRAAQLFGIMTKNMQNDIPTVKLLGNIDAYNYYNAIGSISLIQGNLLNITGNKDISDIIIGISKCDPNYDKYGVLSENTGKERHKFETVLKVNGVDNDRHPFFKDNKWVHFYDKKGVSLIPSKFRKYEDYQRDYVYEVDGGKPYFVPAYRQNNYEVEALQNTLYPSDTVRLNKKGISLDMFNIFNDPEYVASIINRYEKLNNGGVKVINYDITDDSGLKTFTEKYWKVSNERYAKFFTAKDMLSVNLATLGVNTDYYFTSDVVSGETPTVKNEATRKEPLGHNTWYDRTKHKDNVVCKSDGSWSATSDSGTNDVSVDDLVIQDLKLYYFENNTTKYNVNLFGSPFYYLQDEMIKDNDLQRNVKALLFLHTFRYDYSVILNVFAKDKVSGGIECVPYGYLLLLGGLLWRKRQSKDPIVYKDSEVDYHPCDKNHTLFTKLNGEYYFAVGGNNATTSKMYNVTVDSLFGGNSSIDYNIEEQLIELFLNFSKNDFGSIKNSLEIINWYVPSKGGSKKSQRYTPFLLKKDAEIFHQKFTDKKRTAAQNMKWLRNNGICMNNGTVVRYRMFAVQEGISEHGFKMLFNEDDKDMQSKLKDIYLRKCIVSDSCARVMGNNNSSSINDTVSVDNSVFTAYIKGFTEKLKEIVDTTSKVRTTDNNLSPTQNDRLNYNRNLCIAIYYYLKNVWDRWMVGKAENTYDVATFFSNDFIFMDSFYRNTFYRLPLNCQKVIDAYEGAAKDKSLYSFIGDICQAHDCWFMAVPDFIHFTGEDTTDGHNMEGMYSDIELMKNVFRPMPYNEITAPQNNNKFVIIYIHKLSEVPSSINNFRYDSFDIWSHTEGFNVAPPIFKSDRLLENSDDTITRLGYKVPSFGVSFARQNQHLFKNIKVDMNNPVQTEQAIKTYHNLISVGKSKERKIAFTGQDVFNIYTNYSYECEVEMLGDAQICPLMYFQLLNVPMWRGTYMIYKVNHNMTPGNMTTTFRGVKLCRFPKPFGTSFFITRNDIDGRNNGYNINGYGSGGGDYFPNSYQRVNNWSKDWYHDPETGNKKTVEGMGIDSKGGKVRNEKLVSLFNRLYEEIALLPENKPTMKWNVVLSHVLRAGSGKSAHYKGNAMDLTIGYYDKNGKCTSTPQASGRNPQPELAQACDILAALHLNEIDQLILEYANAQDMANGRYEYYNCLHIGVLSNSGTVRSECWIGSPGGQGYTYINKYYPNDFLSKVNPKFKATAKRAFYADSTNFKRRFLNYNGCTNVQLEQHFGKPDYIGGGNYGRAFQKWMEWTVTLEGGEKATKYTPHGYGIETQAWNAYHKATKRNDYNHVNYYKWAWDHGNASSIKDDNIKIIYARGHFFIPGVISSNMISSLNSMSPQQAFNAVMKKIGDFMLNKKRDDGTYTIDYNLGWRKFVINTKYGDYHNVYNDKNKPTVQDVKNYVNSL